MKAQWQRTDRDWDIVTACIDIECGNLTEVNEIVEAWAFVAVNGYHRSLQGSYGRQVSYLKESGILNADGTPNWEEIDARIG